MSVVLQPHYKGVKDIRWRNWGDGLTCSQIQPKPQVCVQMCDSKCSRAHALDVLHLFCLHLAQSVCTALIIRRLGSVGNCTFSVHWCLHLSALVCTAAVAVQMVQAGGENGYATRVSRHRGSGRPIGATENPLPPMPFPALLSQCKMAVHKCVCRW